MNIILFKENERLNNFFFLINQKEKIEHINTTLKAEIGDEIEAGIENNKLGKAKIIKKSTDSILFEFIPEKEPPAKLPIILICAVPRPKFLKRIIKDAVTMGVESIYFVRTWKVEKNFFESGIFDEGKIKEHIYLGLEQGKDTVIPKIELKKSFKKFVEDELPIISEGKEKIVAHPGGKLLCPHSIIGKCVLFIGPEGGFTDYEIDMIEKAGFKRVSIGERILRVETAIPFIIGKIIL
jgi:16S rRNA (uracil1498-N3)-methyltransferase